MILIVGVLGHQATTRVGLLLIQRRASAISRARTGGFQPSRWTSTSWIASYVVHIIGRAVLARSAHNLVVEAVDLRLDTTTPLAGPVISPAVDLLLGRLQVTALDDWPGWRLRRGDADEERKL